jgi:hypothetical protein
MNAACGRWKRTFLTVKRRFKILFSGRVLPESWSVKSLQGAAKQFKQYQEYGQSSLVQTDLGSPDSQMGRHFRVGNHLAH